MRWGEEFANSLHSFLLPRSGMLLQYWLKKAEPSRRKIWMRQKKQERGRTGDTIFHCNTFASSYLTTKINNHIEYLPSPQPHFQITVSRTKVIMRRKLYLQKKPFNPVFTWPPLMKIPEFFNLPLETGRLCMLALNSQHSQHRGFPGTERGM